MIINFAQCQQSALGAVTPAAKIQIAAAPGSGLLQLFAIEMGFADTGSCFVQLHDALAADVSSDTMLLPFGIPLDAATQLAQFLSWSSDQAPFFKTAVTLAASSTRLTYTASTKLFVAKGRWG